MPASPRAAPGAPSAHATVIGPVLVTPRLTLRPPIGWDGDELAELAGSQAGARTILARAAFVILRERLIGWADGGGVTIAAPFRGRGFGREAAAAVAAWDAAQSAAAPADQRASSHAAGHFRIPA